MTYYGIKNARNDKWLVFGPDQANSIVFSTPSYAVAKEQLKHVLAVRSLIEVGELEVQAFQE